MINQYQVAFPPEANEVGNFDREGCAPESKKRWWWRSGGRWPTSHKTSVSRSNGGHQYYRIEDPEAKIFNVRLR